MRSPTSSPQLAGAVSTQPRVHEARAFVFELVGVGEHEYDTVTEVLGEDPPGRLFHLAGPTEDGWMVVSVWESQEAFDAFLTERLLPVVRKVGFFASLPQSFPIHNMEGLAASW